MIHSELLCKSFGLLCHQIRKVYHQIWQVCHAWDSTALSTGDANLSRVAAASSGSSGIARSVGSNPAADTGWDESCARARVHVAKPKPVQVDQKGNPPRIRCL